MGIRTKRTPKKQADFLRLLAEGNSVGDAALAIGCQRRTVYDWRSRDAAFRRAWDDALDQATEAIESVLYGKAKDGDLLACIFWLKAHRPAIYNRRQVEVGGAAAAPPIAIPHEATHRHVVFYLPQNHRDRPEEVPDVIEAERDEEPA